MAVAVALPDEGVSNVAGVSSPEFSVVLDILSVVLSPENMPQKRIQ